ncbi:MAG: hypothetical protein KTR29_08315 [Rhodothermaceae bacterium]|nr:hypothetical protein [Rhodothermaceae bacterium]
MATQPANEYLRHTLSTIAYRFQKSVHNTSDTFGDFSAGKSVRTPIEIINHMYRVLCWTRTFIQEERFGKTVPEKLDLHGEIKRFNGELKALDDVLTRQELGIDYAKRLLQGPLSDILTHVGQLSMLCRLDDHPIEGEDFSSASIQTGVLSYFG